jgi:isoleucyl-tRNA synthetase
MRWLFATVNPSVNVNFGFHVADEVRRRFILPLWNSYSFFATYARLDGFDPTDPSTKMHVSERPLLDRWIISQLNKLIQTVRTALDAYEPDTASNAIENFVVEELSNWYIRRNRRRFWKSESDADKAAAYHTLHECLVTVTGLLAPFIPFITESIYQNLVRSVNQDAPESIHLTNFPQVQADLIDDVLSAQMSAVIEAVKLGRAARSAANVKVRQPLPALLVYARNREDFDAINLLQDQVLEELNVKEIRPLSDVGEVVAYNIRPNLPALGPKYGKQLGAIRQALAEVDAGLVAGLVGADRPVELTMPNGEALWLEPSEVLVDLNKREGFAAAQGATMTVALDTELTPELIEEGWVRDFVRGVQDARKTAGLQIDDRINLSYSADEGLADAITRNLEYIKSETLATSVEAGNANGDPIEVGESQVGITVTKA